MAQSISYPQFTLISDYPILKNLALELYWRFPNKVQQLLMYHYVTILKIWAFKNGKKMHKKTAKSGCHKMVSF